MIKEWRPFKITHMDDETRKLCSNDIIFKVFIVITPCEIYVIHTLRHNRANLKFAILSSTVDC